MSLSVAGAAQGIRDYLTEQSEAAAGFSLPSIAAMLPAISEAFAREIAQDDNKRDLLTPTTAFTNTITGGFCDLATNMASPDLLLLDFVHYGEIRLEPDTLEIPFHWVNERGQLRLRRPTDPFSISCARSGSVLCTRATDGSLIADLGAITISAPFIPVISETAASSTLPFALEGEYLRFGARMVIGSELKMMKRPA